MKRLIVLFALLAAVGMFATGALAADLPPHVDAWLKEHRIGPYQEEVVDYDELYELALQEEGPVVVYAGSSRGPAALEAGFYERFPGIEVEWNTLNTSGAIERLMREQQAGIYTADILFGSDMPTQVGMLNPANMVFPWVPSELRDVIPEEFQSPLLAHRYEARVLFYNDDAYDTAPLESWWDLTKPEWERNIVLEDPRTSGSTLDFFTTFVVEADAMAEEYERVFGEPIKLTTPNAGYEFIKRLIENRPRIIGRDSDGRFLAERGQENPPVGMSFAFSRIRDAGDPERGDLRWTVATDLKPAIGMLYPSGINIAFGAPNPNSAKLVVAWFMGDEYGGQGMTPWFVPGNWPSRTDVVSVPDHPFLDGRSWSVNELNFWNMDAQKLWQIKQDVLEFVQVHMR